MKILFLIPTIKSSEAFVVVSKRIFEATKGVWVFRGLERVL